MVSEETIRQLQLYAKNFKKERCGVVLSNDTIVEITNVSSDSNSFVFSKREWYRILEAGLTIKYVWHTHPSTTDPSDADLNFIKKSGLPALIVTEYNWRWIGCPES